LALVEIKGMADGFGSQLRQVVVSIGHKILPTRGFTPEKLLRLSDGLLEFKICDFRLQIVVLGIS
jgi:hypothetical protein